MFDYVLEVAWRHPRLLVAFNQFLSALFVLLVELRRVTRDDDAAPDVHFVFGQELKEFADHICREP